MGKHVSPENLVLGERLIELLTECWPEERTTQELVAACGLTRETWTWCSGGSNCYEMHRLLGTLPSHIHQPIRHYRPHEGVRTGKASDGNLMGYDTFRTGVTYQIVYPQLGRLHKEGKVEKRSGISGVCWSAIDNGLLQEREAEAMEILRRTLERAREKEERKAHGEPEPEPEPPEPDFFERLVFC